MLKINSQDWINKTVGKYRIILEISRGRNGVVFLAENEQIKEKAAVKILTSYISPETVLESIKKSAELSHKGLVKIFDYGSLENFNSEENSEEDSSDFSNCYYIAMEFIGKLSSPGATFASQKSIVARNFMEFISNAPQYLSESAVIDLLLQLLDILEYVHGNENFFGIPYGGIFPNNFLIEDAGPGNFNLRVAEFGVAVNPKSNPGIGPFLSSEEIQGHPLDQRSDVYTLGAITYALIAGVPPQSPVVPPSKIRTDILPDWDKLIQQTLSYEPKDRLSSYKKFKSRILKFRKHVRRPWIRPITSGLLTAFIIIAILFAGYLGYKFFEINKGYFRKIGNNIFSKAAKVISSKEKTEKPKAAPVITNLPETSDLTVAQAFNVEHAASVSNQRKPTSQKAVSNAQNVAHASTIPRTDNGRQKTVDKAQSTKHKVPSANKYTVQKGDTYYSLSRKFKCDVKKLQELNKNQALKTGQKIKLP